MTASGDEFFKIFRYAGNDDDGNALVFFVFFHITVKSHPAFFRHTDVEGDQVGPLILNLLQCILPIFSHKCFVAGVFEQGGKEGSNIGLIINDKYLLF